MRITKLIVSAIFAMQLPVVFGCSVPAPTDEEASLEIRARNNDVNRQIALANNGDVNWLNFYNTAHTDELIARISPHAPINYVHLELTDITDSGLLGLSKIRSLRELSIVGGRPLGSREASSIAAIKQLKKLNLRGVHCTTASLIEIVNQAELTRLSVTANEAVLNGSELAAAISTSSSLLEVEVAHNLFRGGDLSQLASEGWSESRDVNGAVKWIRERTGASRGTGGVNGMPPKAPE